MVVLIILGPYKHSTELVSKLVLLTCIDQSPADVAQLGLDVLEKFLVPSALWHMHLLYHNFRVFRVPYL